MPLWRYLAVTPGGRQNGELSGESAADVRASLRRLGLRVLEVRPARSRIVLRLPPRGHASWCRHLRQRRRRDVAEIYDSLATLLGSGLPLLESFEAISSSTKRRGVLRTMLAEVRESLRGGDALSDAIGAHPGWFGPVEIAMVGAGQHSGTLEAVLRSLAERHVRADELTHKLVGVLTYPVVVAAAGLAVVVFLSVRTLPELTQILIDNDVAVPALTQRVMGFGQALAHWWPALLLGVPVCLAALAVVRRLAVRSTGLLGRVASRLSPAVLRRMAVADMSLRLAELLRSGVPIVEGLRVLAPTASSPALAVRLRDAASAVERGEELSEALDDERWFDGEFRRLLDIGQASGELDDLLMRIGQRERRRAARLIDRLASLLEPALIVALASLVGVVAMAAVLPLVRLREIL